jgi:hypothetical protein
LWRGIGEIRRRDKSGVSTAIIANFGQYRSSRYGTEEIAFAAILGGVSNNQRCNMPGESFDAVSEPSGPSPNHDADARVGRKFVGVKFECCATYARIYLNREQTAYVGNCPRCAKQLRLRVGPGGTDSRFFTVR